MVTMTDEEDPPDPRLGDLIRELQEMNAEKERLVNNSKKTMLCTLYILKYLSQHSQENELKMLDVVIKKDFHKNASPFVLALDVALKSFNVYFQVYHSQSFVGNHVHRTLKVIQSPYNTK